MALRDQPYLPLFIQDIMTDEKLNECSASTHGIYIKGLMCLMHKSDCYGKILLKQNYKQTPKQSKNFALQLVKHLPYSANEIENAIDELINEKVCYFDGDYICQKRMIKDNELSLVRAKSGSKGGKFAQAKDKAKDKANTEYENEDEIKKKRYIEYCEHLNKMPIYERLARNKMIKPTEIRHCINEFIETKYSSIGEKKDKYEVEEYFLNWVSIDGQVLKAVNNQMKKRNAKQ